MLTNKLRPTRDRKYPIRLDDITKQELLAMYADGATFFELMKMFDISMLDVQRIIKESIK